MTPANKNYLGVALAGLAVILFWVFVMPVWNRISSFNEAIAEREGILASREEILRRIEDLNNQYRERVADVGKISSVVPNAKNSAELVSTFETISRQTGMQLVEITMGESEDQQEMQRVFLELGLNGSYPSFIAFLELAERNLRLVDVHEISVSQASAPGGQTLLNFRVELNAYYVKVK